MFRHWLVKSVFALGKNTPAKWHAISALFAVLSPRYALANLHIQTREITDVLYAIVFLSPYISVLWGGNSHSIRARTSVSDLGSPYYIQFVWCFLLWLKQSSIGYASDVRFRVQLAVNACAIRLRFWQKHVYWHHWLLQFKNGTSCGWGRWVQSRILDPKSRILDPSDRWQETIRI
jgi:hypothetical protein